MWSTHRPTSFSLHQWHSQLKTKSWRFLDGECRVVGGSTPRSTSGSVTTPRPALVLGRSLYYWLNLGTGKYRRLASWSRQRISTYHATAFSSFEVTGEFPLDYKFIQFSSDKPQIAGLNPPPVSSMMRHWLPNKLSLLKNGVKKHIQQTYYKNANISKHCEVLHRNKLLMKSDQYIEKKSFAIPENLKRILEST